MRIGLAPLMRRLGYLFPRQIYSAIDSPACAPRANIAEMASPYDLFVLEEKRMVRFPGWSKPRANGEMSFVADLEIGGVSYENLHLRGTCIEHLPEREVMFQLEVSSNSERTRVPLMRVDWNPTSGGHRNAKKGLPERLRGRFIKGSHFHPFEENWLEDEGCMRAINLPVALEIHPTLQSFNDLLDFVKKSFRISDLSSIQTPEWVSDMFKNGN